jgi:hypothetical protein
MLAAILSKLLPNGRPWWEQREFDLTFPAHFLPEDTVIYRVGTREYRRVVEVAGVLRSQADAIRFVMREDEPCS